MGKRVVAVVCLFLPPSVRGVSDWLVPSGSSFEWSLSQLLVRHFSVAIPTYFGFLLAVTTARRLSRGRNA